MNKQEAKKIVEDIAKELCSVQPMPNNMLSLLHEHGKDAKQLEEEGYKPVSRLGLLWIKKDENK